MTAMTRCTFVGNINGEKKVDANTCLKNSEYIPAPEIPAPTDTSIFLFPLDVALPGLSGLWIYAQPQNISKVMSVINRRPKLQKISFVAHSLGGLVARYAIGRLYKLDILRESDQGNGVSFVGDKSKGKIALDLEPMNFITFATPHLELLNPDNDFEFFSGLNSVVSVVLRYIWRGVSNLCLVDSRVFLYLISKCKRYFHNRLKPSKLTDGHIIGSNIRRQDIAAEAVKTRRRATKKPYSRPIVGATLEVIQKKRTEKTEAPDATCEAALR
ncbi:hypothetical protein IFM89_010284 [Coptis chinensis]|uniref:DUF676 domain-containing protein n=1 Tax=Coptis chinensis TaxID=261450 RepID=A0A835LLQ4_9MAGN|nr:hypothetical protein IFM89_010284 [Coptis chinensis]